MNLLLYVPGGVLALRRETPFTSMPWHRLAHYDEPLWGSHPVGTAKGSFKGAFIIYVPGGILALRRETPFTSLPWHRLARYDEPL
ncbi:hypothetical protein [Paenibacillus sanguinis]|uniref:hypothetical protein n=1 Tax=Paenibacillus sanguinis TaxID=225906 RepID=UPI0012B59B86|nr:hypothetical protein [Paenibacillus sanguinis]